MFAQTFTLIKINETEIAALLLRRVILPIFAYLSSLCMAPSVDI